MTDASAIAFGAVKTARYVNAPVLYTQETKSVKVAAWRAARLDKAREEVETVLKEVAGRASSCVIPSFDYLVRLAQRAEEALHMDDVPLIYRVKSQLVFRMAGPRLFKRHYRTAPAGCAILIRGKSGWECSLLAMSEATSEHPEMFFLGLPSDTLKMLHARIDSKYWTVLV